MLTFAESKHPVFRSASPLSRGADGDTIETVFRTITPSISSVFTEQLQICTKNVTPALIKQGDLLWQDNLTHCREYTLPREEEASQPKGSIRGNTKMGPLSEFTTCCLQGKYGVEKRICLWKVLGLNFSWIKQVFDELKQHCAGNSRSSARRKRQNWMRRIFHADQRLKEKAQRREPAGSSPRTVPIVKRTRTDVEQGKYSFSDHEVLKKLMHLLCHGQHKHREDDGAVQFWIIKENL